MNFAWYSPTQCMGYVAFVLGVGSFVQTDDRRFKLFNIGECLAYATHFAMLGNSTAVAASLISTCRSVIAIRTRSPWVAAAVIAANASFGLVMATQPTDWLPLLASCVGTIALFLFTGIAMRLLMLCGIGLLISNNIIVGSIGGTALEIVVGLVNLVTMYRLWIGGHTIPIDGAA